MSELINTFERLKVADHFGNPRAGEEYFRSLDYNAWMGQVDEMNAAMRGLHKYDVNRGLRNNSVYAEVPGAPRNHPVGGVLYVAPYHGDVDVLQQRAFRTAQQLPDMSDAADLQYLSYNLTQRYWNGNLRTAGVVRSLLTVGYNTGNHRNRRSYDTFYTTLAKGRKGVQSLGLEMDLTHLQRSFAASEIDQIRQHFDYDDLVPTGVAPFKVSTLRRVQPNMAAHNVTHTAHLLAEPFMNVPLTTRFILTAGARVMDYLRANPNGPGYVIDAPRLVREIPLHAFGALHAQDNLRKGVFVNSIIEAFRNRHFIYGRNHREMLARLVPPTNNAG